MLLACMTAKPLTARSSSSFQVQAHTLHPNTGMTHSTRSFRLGFHWRSRAHNANQCAEKANHLLARPGALRSRLKSWCGRWSRRVSGSWWVVQTFVLAVSKLFFLAFATASASAIVSTNCCSDVARRIRSSAHNAWDNSLAHSLPVQSRPCDVGVLVVGMGTPRRPLLYRALERLVHVEFKQIRHIDCSLSPALSPCHLAAWESLPFHTRRAPQEQDDIENARSMPSLQNISLSSWTIWPKASRI